MSITGIIAGIFKTIEIIDKYVDDPKRRRQAKEELYDSFIKGKEEALNEEDREKMDSALLALLNAIDKS